MITTIAGQANTVGVDIIDPQTGLGVESGTVAIYLIQRRGDDAGKWWNGTAGEWSATEASCGEATHESAGHWTIDVDADAWVSGDAYRLYGVLDGGSYVSHSLDVLCISRTATWPGETGDWPITVDEFKRDHVIELTFTDDDQLIDALIGAATRWSESYCNRKWLTQTCTEVFDQFPAMIRPRWSPLIAVTSISYIDSAGATQTLDAAEYQVDEVTEPGRIAPAYGESWPSTRSDLNAVTLVYTAGYGSAGSDVPPDVRTAISMLAGSLYENREDTSPITLATVPIGARVLLGMHRLINV